MSNETSFGIGVIGATGFIGTPYRREIRESGDPSRIVALCARRRDRLEAAAIEDGATLTSDDWRDVVEHPDVNLVLVCTPDALHYEPVLECARLGKHVFCEKPVGNNAQEARDMWHACRDAAVGHYVPFWTRYVPAFARAREIVRAGTLGEIKAVIYRWHNPRPPSIPHTWRDDASLSSAGSVADVGSHAYDAVRWIIGSEATRVLAHADTITPPKPDLGAIDLAEAIEWGQSHAAGDSAARREATAYDYASVAWEFDCGAVGAIVFSHAHFLRKGLCPELEFHGTEASLALNRIDSSISIVRGSEVTAEVTAVEDPGFGNRFEKHVFDAIRERADGGSSDHPGLDDGYRVQLFTDAAAASAKQGAWVRLDSFEAELQRP